MPRTPPAAARRDSEAPALSLPRERVERLLALVRSSGAEFAEVYAERTLHTTFALDERQLKRSSISILEGVGVRAIRGAETGYAYADGFADADLETAARAAAAIARGGSPGPIAPLRVSDPAAPFVLRHPAPLGLDEGAKVALLRRADDAARSYDPRIREAEIGLIDSTKQFVVANSDGLWAEERQYLTRFAVTTLALEGDQRQQGFAAAGGCVETEYFETVRTPEAVASEAAATAITLLSAREPEAGSYPVVVAPGWGGVMVHECFGHSMEGDGIRRRTSIRADQRGQHVASRGVTIVDSGIVPYSRGSFRIDDEGTAAQRTVLVEDGVLVGYLWDLLNARLMSERATGNGRRASYRDVPLCRMTNTYIEAGPETPEALIASVRKGLYCKSMGGGSVNPADGNFSFQVTEAVMIEDGRLTHPCLLYTSPSPRDRQKSRMPSSA